MNIRTIVSASRPVRDDEVISVLINSVVTEEEVAAKQAQKDRDIRRRAAAGTPLLAQIKKSSKYFGQGKQGSRFPVSIQTDCTCGYVVCGGPGGQYRLADVSLFAIVGDSQVKLT